MGRLKDYPIEKLVAGDVLIKDSSRGTKTRKVDDLLTDLIDIGPAEMHRNIYRGKNLGTSITEDQKTQIKNGTFKDLFVGDYWTLNGKKWIIADFDYWYNTGDTAFTKHHLAIVPERQLYSAKMNETSTTDGGYIGSQMYTTNLEEAKTTINTAFGDMVLSHREYLTNATKNGIPTASAWVDSTVELMNEIMVYGTAIFSATNTGATVPTLHTVENTQLALFRLNPSAYRNRDWFWLRDVVSSTTFAVVSSGGPATHYSASISYGVRPAFAIG